jgi:hypothetical protein
MNANTNEVQNGGRRPLLWAVGAVGVGVGIASWAYKRSRRSRWDNAKAQGARLVEYAREEVKPWMGVAAGTAAAGTAAAIYKRSRQRSPSERVAAQARRTLQPWAGVAINAAISLASAVYSQRARKSANRALKGTQKNAAEFAERGLGLLRLFGESTKHTAKRYPKLRKLIA